MHASEIDSGILGRGRAAVAIVLLQKIGQQVFKMKMRCPLACQFFPPPRHLKQVFLVLWNRGFTRRLPAVVRLLCVFF